MRQSRRETRPAAVVVVVTQPHRWTRRLIERMRALIVEEIDTASVATKSWDEALIDWAESYLAAFAQRPNCIRSLATTPITDPSVFCM